MSNFIKKNDGYTLIELIVSIAIIAIISSIMLANYRTGGVSSDLSSAAQNLASEIREVQAYSLGYKEFNGNIRESGTWGIRLTSANLESPEKFILFFDVNDNGIYDGASELYQEGLIGKNVKVFDIKVDGISQNFFWGLFYPPDPKIDLYGKNTNVPPAPLGGDEVEIVLEHISGEKKSIFLNRYGLVDVNN